MDTRRWAVGAAMAVLCLFVAVGCEKGEGIAEYTQQEEGGGGTTTSQRQMSITLEASPPSIAGGATSTTVTATLTWDDGSPVEDGTVVYFEFSNTTAADFATGASITSSATSSEGKAVAIVTAGSRNGELLVEAYVADGTRSDPLRIVVSDITYNVSLSGSETIVAGGARVKYTATVVTSGGAPVSGASVTFSTTSGTLYADEGSTSPLSGAVTTDAAGMASVYLAVPAGSSGELTLTARTTGPEGESLSSSLKVDVEPYLVTISPIGSLKANGIDYALVRVNVKDGSGSGVEGVLLRFETSLGSITTSAADGSVNPSVTVEGYPACQTDAAGDAVARLDAGDVAGVATVTVSVLAALDDSDPANILMQASGTAEIKEVQPARLVLNATPSVVRAGSGSVVTITGLLTDAEGDPIADREIRFETSDPDNTSITPSATTSAEAGSEGQVAVNFSSGTVAGLFTVTATVVGTDLTAQLQVEVQSGDPFLIKVKDGYPTPSVIRVKGTGGDETSRVVFVVTDQYGNPVSDSLGVEVNVRIESGPGGGELVSPSLVRVSNGEAAANVVSGVRTGTVKVRAEVVGDVSLYAVSTAIAIVEGPLSTASIGIVPDRYNIAGRVWTGLEDSFTAYLADEAGDAVPDGTAVTFVTNETGGMFKSGTDTTVDGQASDVLVSTKNPQPIYGFVSTTVQSTGESVVALESLAVNADGRFFAGTDGAGMFAAASMEDGLRSWEKADGRYAFMGPRVFDIAIPENSPNVVFTATSHGLFKSDNTATTFLAARNPSNPNLAGFRTPGPATAVALASYYLVPPGDPLLASVSADRLCRRLDAVDVLVGTAGYGVFYNVSAGCTYQILDADGTALTDSGSPESSFLTDGTLTSYFDGSEGLMYRPDSDSSCGYDFGVDWDGDGIVDAMVLDEDGDGAGQPFWKVNSYLGSPSHYIKYVDRNGDGTWEPGEEIVNTQGWYQSPVLGTGVFVNRIVTLNSSGVDYAVCATESGVFRSSSAGGKLLGFDWTDIGDDDVDFTATRITDLVVSGKMVFASSHMAGMFVTADVTADPVDWSALPLPAGVDVQVHDGTASSADGDVLLPFGASDRVMFVDADGDGVFSGADPVFLDVDADGVYLSDEDVVLSDAASYDHVPADGDAGVSAVLADGFLRYVDADGDGVYDAGEDIYIDMDSDGVLDVKPEDYSFVTALAYDAAGDVLVCGTRGGGVFVSSGGASTGSVAWTRLDSRLTGTDIASLLFTGGKLYVGGAESTLVEYDPAAGSYKDVSAGEGNTRIDTSIMDRAPVLFSGHISPRIEADFTRDHIAKNPSLTNETDNFVFAVVLEDDFGNPPVAGTQVSVSATLHEITISSDNGVVTKEDNSADLSVGGPTDYTIPDTTAAGVGSTILVYNIAPQLLDGDYDGYENGAPASGKEYVEVTVTVTFPAYSNYGGDSGGTWEYTFKVYMK